MTRICDTQMFPIGYGFEFERYRAVSAETIEHV
jgi:hypothetical protein